MLTIFGKKKKDETEAKDQNPSDSVQNQPQSISTPTTAPTSTSSVQNLSNTPNTMAPQAGIQGQPQTMRPPSQQVFRPPPPMSPLPAEETSLTKLLQSLLADIPLPPGVGSGLGDLGESTPDYVPVRSTPPSRAMVIGPSKDSGDWEEGGDRPTKAPIPPSKPVKPAEPQPSAKVPQPTPTPQQKKEQPPDKSAEKPSRIEKTPEKPTKEVAPKKEPRTPQNFDHIFQLTQGNLENTGLVVINATAGSGRTTLCSGLTGNYMKNGSPCLYLTYDQAPSALRDQMKKLGTDAAQYESSFRFIIIDGFASQSESFSMEPYYLDQPFNFDNIQETVARNSQFFIGEKIKVILDSLDTLAAKVNGKEFTKGFGDLVSKLKESGTTFIVTVDVSKLSKDLAGALTDLADCIIDLSKDESDPNARELKVQRLNHSPAKVDAETFEIDNSKGLVFV